MRLKISVLRSNPHIIYEVQITDSMTSDDLRDLISICFQLDAGECEIMMADGEYEGKKIVSAIPLKDQMLEGEIWILSMKEYQDLRISIEVLDKKENSAKYPELLRTRGYCIPSGISTLKQMNSQMEWQTKEIPEAEIQKRLKYRFSDEYAHEMMPHWEAAKSLDTILTNMKKDELKLICERNFPYVDLYQNKRPLIEDIEDEYEELGFDWVLEELDLKEYLTLKERYFGALSNRNGNSYDLPQLRRLGLAGYFERDGLCIAREFMEYLEMTFLEDDDSERIRLKAMKNVLAYGIEVYAVLPKHIAEALFQKYYPEYFEKESFEQNWNIAELEYEEEGYKKYGNIVPMPVNMSTSDRKTRNQKLILDIYYNSYMMKQRTANAFAQGVYPYPEHLWYMPSKERFEEIAEQGLGFDAKRMMELRSFFKDEYYVDQRHINSLGRDIYHRIHLNWERKDIIEAVLKPFYLFNKKKVTKNLETFLEEVWEDVSRVQYLGNTMRFWKDMVKE